MKTALYLLIAGFSFFGAGTPTQSDAIKKAEWLIGTWENKTPRGIIYETWRKKNEREYVGQSYILKDKDTIVFETIQLIQDQNTLFYIPTVKDQNNNKPVHFIAKTVTETQLVFENKQHDFPQIITYTQNGQDALIAEISGIKNGKERKQTFPMRRIK